MLYGDFEALAFEYAGLLLFYWGIGFFGLFLLTKKYTSGMFLDPFHFYYAFTYGTSYGVVALLLTLGMIDAEAGWIVFGFGAIFLILFRFFSTKKVIDFNFLVKLTEVPSWRYKKCIILMMSLYVVLVGINLWVSGFGFMAESRFESSTGYGPIIRLVESLRLLLTAWFGLKIIRRIQAKESFFLQSCLFVCFILFSSLLNGAKFALLEGCYAVSIAAVVANIKFKLSPLSKFLLISIFFIFIFVFVLVVITFNISNTGGDPFLPSDSINGVPVLIERLIGRIVWNGDMYFLSLPNEIYKSIYIDNFLIRFASAIFGSQLLTNILGYDVAQLEVGRLIWLYWAPDDTVMRGPTNHFDLTGYFYFGPIGGGIFVAFLALIFSQVNRLVVERSDSSDYRAVIIGVLWCKSAAMLMHPAAGFAWCIDTIMVLLLCKLILSLFGTSRKSFDSSCFKI